jgi:serine/threonine protein kinase
MPEFIGRYEVLSVLGDGGMGTVYKARDPRFDRIVALKVLHPQLQRDPGTLERFKIEAVIQAKLNHPHIVVVYDFLEEGSQVALVMQHAPGKALDRLLQEQGRMPIARAVALLVQVLDAIQYAHENGLVHRDLKPANILVESTEVGDFVRVTDFGVAKVLGATRGRTATGARIGTLDYMAPEQLRHPKDVDGRADIYALGVVLYELLTGVVPFDDDTELGLMQKIVESHIDLPRSREPSIPTALEEVILRAMAREPHARFCNCRDFRAELLSSASPNVPNSGPVAAPITSWRDLAPETPSPFAGAAPSAGETSQKIEANRPPEATSRSRSWLGWGFGIALVLVILIALLAQKRGDPSGMDQAIRNNEPDNGARPPASVSGTVGSPTTGKLELTITPSAAIAYLDGQRCVSDHNGKIVRDVMPGVYSVRVEAEGYETSAASVEVDAGGVANRIFSLVPHRGSVTVSTNIPSQVAIRRGSASGEVVHSGRGGSQATLMPGVYVISIQPDAGGRPWSTTVSVAPGRRVAVNHDFEVVGTVILTFPVTWGYVEIDGKSYGDKSRLEATLPVGRHRVVVSRDGYKNFAQEVSIGPGERLHLPITLKPQE